MKIKTPQTLSFFTLIVLAAFAAFGAMLPVAVAHDIAGYFSISLSRETGVITWYLLGYAGAQLLYGPLANRWGRRGALLFGSILALCAGALSCVAVSFNAFHVYLFARFLCGLGAGAGLMIGMILIRDLYVQARARQIFSRVVLTFSGVPFVAIALGGVMTTYLGWKSLNIILTIYAGLVLGLIFRIPETLAQEKQVPISWKNLVHAYKMILNNARYLRWMLAFGLATAINYTFTGVAPVWVMKAYHISAETYGYLSVLPGLGLLLGGYLSQKCALRVSGPVLARLAGMLLVIASLGLTIGFLMESFSIVIFYGCVIFLYCGQAMMIANAGMEALSHVTDAANGSALMNALALMGGSGMVALVSEAMTYSHMSLPIALLGMSVILPVLCGIRTSTLSFNR